MVIEPRTRQSDTAGNISMGCSKTLTERYTLNKDETVFRLIRQRGNVGVKVHFLDFLKTTDYLTS